MMNCHKLAVLLAVLFMACLSSSNDDWAESKLIFNPDDHYLGINDRPKEWLKFDQTNREYEEELNNLRHYYGFRGPSRRAKKYITWILRERKTLAKTRPVFNMINSFSTTLAFWKHLDRYATYEYNTLRKSLPLRSLGSRISVALTDSRPLSEERMYLNIQAFFNRYAADLPLTKFFLNLRYSVAFRPNEKVVFDHAIATAIKFDARSGALDENALREIARSLFRVDCTYPKFPKRKTIEIIINSPAVRKYLSKEQIDILREETETMELIKTKPSEMRYALMPNRRKLGTRANVEEILRKYRNDDEIGDTTPCGYMLIQRRQRRSTSECLLSEKEYREIVKREGGVEVLDTEKFMELLDRVTAEDSAAKREQLLELGAGLVKDKRMSLEGNSVAEFRDAVKILDGDSSKEMQLPENPGGISLASEFRALPQDQLTPRLADDRISATRPLEIFHGPMNIHAYGGVNPYAFVPVEFRPLSVPEIFRPKEITPGKFVPDPEVMLHMPKLRRPMIQRG